MLLTIDDIDDNVGHKMAKPQGSLITSGFALEISTESRRELELAEVRWHYSQHYLSELRGEEVIENMLSFSLNKKQRALLTSQLVDEKNHTKLFSEQLSRIGLDSRADRYAHGYSDLVKTQQTLSEKVFVFQILTETISAAYCQWRLDHIVDPRLNTVDTQVGLDERRHLLMGETLLNICDQDERAGLLTRTRQLELIKEMNTLCEQTVRQDMLTELIGSFLPRTADKLPFAATSLDRYVAKGVLAEFRNLNRKKSKADRIQSV